MFEVVFRRTGESDAPESEGDQVARNVSPFSVEPGKFTYRLVRGELEFADYGQIFAHCRIDRGPWTVSRSRCFHRPRFGSQASCSPTPACAVNARHSRRGSRR